MDTTTKNKVKNLLRDGNKLEAVKELRSAFKLSLSEAAHMAEALSSSPAFDETWEEKTKELSGHNSSDLANPAEKIKALLLERRKLEAVKLLKELTNSNLKEAKDTVDQMENKLIESGELTPAKSGTGIIWIIFLISLGAALYFFFS